MIFKRFLLRRKKPELFNICEQEMLKSNSLVKTKFLETLYLEYIYRPCLFHFYYITI